MLSCGITSLQITLTVYPLIPPSSTLSFSHIYQVNGQSNHSSEQYFSLSFCAISTFIYIVWERELEANRKEKMNYAWQLDKETPAMEVAAHYIAIRWQLGRRRWTAKRRAGTYIKTMEVERLVQGNKRKMFCNCWQEYGWQRQQCLQLLAVLPKNKNENPEVEKYTKTSGGWAVPSSEQFYYVWFGTGLFLTNKWRSEMNFDHFIQFNFDHFYFDQFYFDHFYFERYFCWRGIQKLKNLREKFLYLKFTSQEIFW